MQDTIRRAPGLYDRRPGKLCISRSDGANIWVGSSGQKIRGTERAEQPTLWELAWSGKGKVTRRGKFLAEMDGMAPWAWRRCSGSTFFSSGSIFPISMAEDELYDSDSIRGFARIEL